MACLYLYKHRLDDIEVIWANTGRNYPEALETISRASEMCPRWHEVRTDREMQWKRNGLPSDLVPVDWTTHGQIFTPIKALKVQSYIQCCYENIGFPVWQKVKELGCTEVIRGVRNDEEHTSPTENLDGIKCIHPLASWTKSEVLGYLKSKMGELPGHFVLEHSSMDCFDCTAFAAHSLDRAEYTRKKHPGLYAEYISGIRALHGAMSVPMKAYERILNA